MDCSAYAIDDNVTAEDRCIAAVTVADDERPSSHFQCLLMDGSVDPTESCTDNICRKKMNLNWQSKICLDALLV